MRDKISELVNLRLIDRDKVFNQDLLAVKQLRASKGLLNSSGTIQYSHEALVKEFELSREIIVNSVTNVLELNNTLTPGNDVSELAQSLLDARKLSLEGIYSSHIKGVMGSLQNKKLISAYSNLDDSVNRSKLELSIELNNAIANYAAKDGANLTERLKNRFLNKPLVAIVAVSIAAVMAIIGFVAIF